jgi:mRNA interferase RelE/StbE
MAVAFEIFYEKVVVREDIPRIASAWRQRIRGAIEEKLTSYPEVFGKPLRRSLKGYRKLRVGDYRIVFRIQGKKVLIFAILHRSVVYKEMEKRS